MKRFLIFTFLFPIIATVSFFAIVYILTGAEVDSFSGAARIYAVFIAPGLFLALVDWGFTKTRILPVIGTTLVVYASAFCIGREAPDGFMRWV